jgi:GNAT superfamily N-acetyltransferase
MRVEEFPPGVWTKQAAQLPHTGVPRSIKHVPNAEAEVLFFYDDVGCLRGILKYFKEDVPRSDEFGDYLVAHAGEILIVVDPDYLRRGVGTELLREAHGRWKIDLGKQRYTPSGAALVDRFRQNEAKSAPPAACTSACFAE